MNSRRKAIFDGVTGARLALAFSGLVAVAIAATILAVDGMPHSGIVSAAGIEIVIGVICLLTLLHFRRAN
ncbi:hypothetical protein [Lentisalinibacter sediminis]|uniref:hypothetical protein n=1 Tax=Lentisalinibacter sediminis TaxID=2992237 RepID=UPI0038664F7E